MCLNDCNNNEDKHINRRDFLGGVSAVIGGAVLSSAINAQNLPNKALDDPKVIQGDVTFKNGVDTIKGYLARPKKEGKYPAVIVLHGPPGIPEQMKNTAAQMAQAGYIGLSVTSTSREPDPSVLTQEFVCSYRFIKRYIDDAKAGIDYLKTQTFLKPNEVGLIGFCGGGITALIFAAISPADLKAVVALYAAPITYPPCFSPTDPRPDVMTLVDKIKVPVQYHYGTGDDVIPLEDVRKFEQELLKHKVKDKLYIYEGAEHAFCDYTRPALYNAKAAKRSHKRAIKFFKKHLK